MNELVERLSTGLHPIVAERSASPKELREQIDRGFVRGAKWGLQPTGGPLNSAVARSRSGIATSSARTSGFRCRRCPSGRA